MLAQHVSRVNDGNGRRPRSSLDAALAAYETVRVEHCRRVVLTARKWGELWHLDGTRRLQRNAILRARDTYDYSFTDWIYGPTALTPNRSLPRFARYRWVGRARAGRLLTIDKTVPGSAENLAGTSADQKRRLGDPSKSNELANVLIG